MEGFEDMEEEDEEDDDYGDMMADDYEFMQDINGTGGIKRSSFSLIEDDEMEEIEEGSDQQMQKIRQMH